MSSVATTDEITTDAVLGGRLILRQPKRGHRAGHDAILLAAATRAVAGNRVVEFGAGVGTAGLAVAKRVSGIDLTLVEIDPALAALAVTNAKDNDLAAHVHVLDVSAGASVFAQIGLMSDTADCVLMNPPFNTGANHRPPLDTGKALAYVASEAMLEHWVKAARRILKSGGELTLIWRADGLADVLAALKSGFGSVVILPVQSRRDRSAIRILLRAIKGGRGPLSLQQPLILLDQQGRATENADAILSGRAILSLAEPTNV